MKANSFHESVAVTEGRELIPDCMKANSFHESVAVTEGSELIPRITTRANPNTPADQETGVNISMKQMLDHYL